MRKSAKYRVGDYVLINKAFGINEIAFGSMEKLEKQRIAEVIEVSLTSTGPAYKLKVVGNPDLKFRALFWEEDIAGPFDI